MSFSLKQHHQWSITEIEDMYPFERDLFVDLLNDHLDREAKKAQAQG